MGIISNHTSLILNIHLYKKNPLYFYPKQGNLQNVKRFEHKLQKIYFFMPLKSIADISK